MLHGTDVDWQKLALFLVCVALRMCFFGSLCWGSRNLFIWSSFIWSWGCCWYCTGYCYRRRGKIKCWNQVEDDPQFHVFTENCSTSMLQAPAAQTLPPPALCLLSILQEAAFQQQAFRFERTSAEARNMAGRLQGGYETVRTSNRKNSLSVYHIKAKLRTDCNVIL